MSAIDTPEGIAFYQLCARKAALSLEIRGLHRSAGRRTAYSICKEVYKLHGSRESVLAQLQAMVDTAIKVKNCDWWHNGVCELTSADESDGHCFCQER